MLYNNTLCISFLFHINVVLAIQNWPWEYLHHIRWSIRSVRSFSLPKLFCRQLVVCVYQHITEQKEMKVYRMVSSRSTHPPACGMVPSIHIQSPTCKMVPSMSRSLASGIMPTACGMIPSTFVMGLPSQLTQSRNSFTDAFRDLPPR